MGADRRPAIVRTPQDPEPLRIDRKPGSALSPAERFAWAVVFTFLGAFMVRVAWSALTAVPL